MNKRNVILSVLGALVLGVGIGYFSKPAEVQEKVRTEVVKEEGKTKIVEKEKIVYKDGTVIEREKTIDESLIRTEIRKELEKTVKRDVGLTIQALAISNTKDFGKDLEYGVLVKKRLVGNISGSVLATSTGKDYKVGVGLGMDF